MLVATTKELKRQITELEVIKTKLEELRDVEQSRLDEMDGESDKAEALDAELELLNTAIEAAEDLGLELQAIIDGED